MPIQDLLAQALFEYEALRAKYEEVLRAKYEQAATENGALHVRTASCATTTLRTSMDPRSESSPPFDSERPGTPIGLHERSSATTCLRESPTKTVASLAEIPHFSSGITCGRTSVESGTSDGPTDFLKMQATAAGREENEGSLRWKMKLLLESTFFEMMIACVVVSNIIVMWISADRRNNHIEWIAAADLVFLVLYSAEFSLRCMAYGMHVLDAHWNKLDFIIVLIDVVFLLMRTVVDATRGFNAKIFRLFRLFRLARIAKLFRFFDKLQLLIHGLIGAMKALVFAAILLWVVIIMWAFVFVEVIAPLVEDLAESGSLASCPRCQDAYSSIFYAHLTLLQTTVAGDNWGLIAFEVIHQYPLTMPIFAGSLITIQLGVMNLILTVIVDAASEYRESNEKLVADEKEFEFKDFRQKFLDICKSLDQDGSGDISLEELTAGIRSNQEFVQAMVSVNITEDDMSTVFKYIDEDHSGEVSYIEFVNNLYKLQKNDLRTTVFFIRGCVNDIRFKIKTDIQKSLSLLAMQLEEARIIKPRAEESSAFPSDREVAEIVPESVPDSAAVVESCKLASDREIADSVPDSDPAPNSAAVALSLKHPLDRDVADTGPCSHLVPDSAAVVVSLKLPSDHREVAVTLPDPNPEPDSALDAESLKLPSHREVANIVPGADPVSDSAAVAESLNRSSDRELPDKVSDSVAVASPGASAWGRHQASQISNLRSVSPLQSSNLRCAAISNL